MKIRITTSPTWIKYFLGALAIILIYDTLKTIVEKPDITQNLQIELAITAVTVLLLYYFGQHRHVEFDKSHVYFSLQKRTIPVSITQITNLRLTPVKINSTNTWKITYSDDDGLSQSVRFLPNKKNLVSFESFKTHLTEVNPDIKIDESGEDLHL